MVRGIRTCDSRFEGRDLNVLEVARSVDEAGKRECVDPRKPALLGRRPVQRSSWLVIRSCEHETRRGPTSAPEQLCCFCDVRGLSSSRCKLERQHCRPAATAWCFLCPLNWHQAQMREKELQLLEEDIGRELRIEREPRCSALHRKDGLPAWSRSSRRAAPWPPPLSLCMLGCPCSCIACLASPARGGTEGAFRSAEEPPATIRVQTPGGPTHSYRVARARRANTRARGGWISCRIGAVARLHSSRGVFKEGRHAESNRCLRRGPPSSPLARRNGVDLTVSPISCMLHSGSPVRQRRGLQMQSPR